MRRLLITVLLASAVTGGWAVSTAWFTDNSTSDFEKGKLDGLAVTERGELALAPKHEAVLAKGDLFVWDLARDAAGNVYAATGTRGNLWKIAPDGTSSLFAKLEGMSVRALAVGRDGTVYAATSPGGRLFALDGKGAARELARFTETYLWDLATGPDGTLYAATGHPARLYAVDTAGGAHRPLFENKAENHFLCLAVNAHGSVFFGTEGNGLLYKRTPDGKVKVLYDTYEDEIASLSIDGQGDVVFGTATQHRRYPVENFNYEDTLQFKEKEHQRPESPAERLKKKVPLKNSVYRVDAHDRVDKVFTLSEGSVYALADDGAGALFIGTGDLGVVYRLEKNGVATRLARLSENQVLCFLRDGARLFAGTGNDGKVFRLDGGGPLAGSYVSQVLDCASTSTFGALAWEGSTPAGTKVEFWTRSGGSDTPDASWSAWAGPLAGRDGERITSPAARYLQYKAVLTSGAVGATPLVQTVRIPFLRQNRAPRVRNVALVTYAESREDKKTKLNPGQCALTWAAVDDDSDTLRYEVWFRFADDATWRILKDDIEQNNIVFPTSLLPDGNVFFRVVASDLPSNNETTYKTGFKDSRQTLIDNTPPAFRDLAAAVRGDEIVVSGRVVDGGLPIQQLRWSLNAKSWRVENPRDGVFDSKTEEIRIVIDRRTHPFLATGRNVLILRAADANDNWTTARVAFDVKLVSGDRAFGNDAQYFRTHELGKNE